MGALCGVDAGALAHQVLGPGFILDPEPSRATPDHNIDRGPALWHPHSLYSKVFFFVLFCFLLFKTNKKQETWRGLYPGRPHKVLLVSVLTPPFQSASFLSLPFLLSFTFYFVYQH